jgi:1,4-dihydroxy-2-naphthoyl-CoA hydrolase
MDMDANLDSGLLKTLGMKIVEENPICVRIDMPITDAVKQPFGFLHGGATISLLESTASRAAELNADLEIELPFGVDVHVRHRKSGTEGVVHGVAALDHEEDLGERGRKQVWNVAAHDDAGDLLSEGVIITQVVPLAYLAKRAHSMKSHPTCSCDS